MGSTRQIQNPEKNTLTQSLSPYHPAAEGREPGVRISMCTVTDLRFVDADKSDGVRGRTPPSTTEKFMMDSEDLLAEMSLQYERRKRADLALLRLFH